MIKGSLTALIALAALIAVPAEAQTARGISAYGPVHPTQTRGPLRPVDLSPFAGPSSSEILASPASGLDSAFVIHTRLKPRTPPRGLYTLPVEHTYLVLSGEARVQLGTDMFTAKPETLVFVPAGVPHRLSNPGGAPLSVLEVIAPAPTADLASMIKPAVARKIPNAQSYVRVPPPLVNLAGGQGHESLNERILLSRASGAQFLQRLNDVLPGGGRTTMHIHPFDQVYFVRKGVMTVKYGTKYYDGKANTLIVIPVGVTHNNTNKGTELQSIVTLLLPEPLPGQPLGGDPSAP